ncbi:hypothetical protein [Paenibacillus naphthalenovorans]|uniref:hypothetical protein n=1 Tax=Paenibacillus naphthalenovorans TaxID=162209 RepID=UPI00088CB5F1|nr:hypothetical protein [Paenibacillus naphthalenovorans]SDJ77059.1 hypothetical protein SAMN05421868_14345 [Paenibacillus naphthalenovorans]
MTTTIKEEVELLTVLRRFFGDIPEDYMTAYTGRYVHLNYDWRKHTTENLRSAPEELASVLSPTVDEKEIHVFFGALCLAIAYGDYEKLMDAAFGEANLS